MGAFMRVSSGEAGGETMLRSQAVTMMKVVSLGGGDRPVGGRVIEALRSPRIGGGGQANPLQGWFGEERGGSGSALGHGS